VAEPIYSRIIEHSFYGRGGLAYQDYRAVHPIFVLNIAGKWDCFWIGTEGQLRHWFERFYYCFGKESFRFDEGGRHSKGLLVNRKDDLRSMYYRFFRDKEQYSHQPALIWMAAGVPYTRSRRWSNQATSLQDQEPKCKDLPTEGRHKHGRASLALLEGHRIIVPPGFLAAPEHRLNRTIVYQRSRRIKELRSGDWLTCRQHHHEIQLGTRDEAEAIKRGNFWLGGSGNDDLSSVLQFYKGMAFFRNYTARLIRLSPQFYAQSSGGIGTTHDRYRMEQTYISLRATNGCPTKVGTIWSDLEYYIGYQPELATALAELGQRQGGIDARSRA